MVFLDADPFDTSTKLPSAGSGQAVQASSGQVDTDSFDCAQDEVTRISGQELGTKTRRHKEKIRRRLTQIDADLFLAGLVFSASSVLKASFRRRDLPSSTRPSKWPFSEAG